MLKRLFLYCIAIGLYSSISAQDIFKPDKRLYDCFSTEELSRMEASKSDLIPYYNYYLDHSYYVVELKSAKKKVTGADIYSVLSRTSGTEVPVKFNMKSYSKETFNPLRYDFNLQMTGFVTYIWEEAGVAIVFYPLQQISNAYKELSKKRNN
jgi:hypothetical protein